jgi:lipid A 4'-phosphatase
MRPILLVCLAILLAAALFLSWPGLDLVVAGLFYRGHGAFLLDGNGLATAFHAGLPVLMQLAAAAILLLLAWDLYGRRRRRADAIRQAVFLAASFIVGPGLVANTLLKDNWGRPRPSQIAPFGGGGRFAPPLLIGDQCPNNCSFVSGDVAAIFAFLAFALLLPAGRPRRLGVGAVVLAGAAMGVVRMGQGGHFLSDVVFAGLFTALVVVLLHRWVAPPAASAG